MPGMRKAARRAAQKRAQAKSSPLDMIRPPDWEFHEAPVAIDTRLVESIVGSNQRTRLPQIRAAYQCSLEDVHRYDDLLRDATHVRLRVAETLVAVDLMQEETPLGRIMTSYIDDRLHEVVAAVEPGATHVHVSLHRDTIVEPSEEADLQLPVSLERVSIAQLCGEPTIEGTGPVLLTVIDDITANHTIRRFKTRKEANAEVQRLGGRPSQPPNWEFPPLWNDLLLYDELMRNTTMTNLGGDTYSITVKFPEPLAA